MKFYKVLREDMTHHDFTYKTGLNVDTVPFNPSGNCLPGGFYFSREDIFAFLFYGDYIAEVVIPPGAQIYEDPEIDPKKWKADKVILKRRKEITAKVIKDLIKDGANTNTQSQLIYYWACCKQADFMKVLIKEFDKKNPTQKNHESRTFFFGRILQLAVNESNVEVVKVLIKAGAFLQYALHDAIYKSNHEIVKLLINAGADIQIKDHWNSNQILEIAVEHSNLQIIKLLLESGCVPDSIIINNAKKYRHKEIAVLLEEFLQKAGETVVHA